MKRKSDCDLLLNDVEQVFGDIGKCFDTAFDERKTKMQKDCIINKGRSLRGRHFQE